MDETVKIAMVTNHFGVTGISTVILNYSRELDRKKYDLTVIVGEPIAEENRAVCTQYGIKLIALPNRHKKPIKYYMQLWKTFWKNKYDIVHVHGSSPAMAIELTIAFLAGIRTRIAHCHSGYSEERKDKKKIIPYLKKTYTWALACGISAGDWVFGNGQYEIIPNGLYTDNFKFDLRARSRIRKELNVEKKYIIGHIGRFNKPKNQSYLLKVFEKVADKREDAVLLLVGDGPDFKEIEAQVNIHTYKDRIILYGVSDTPQEMYSAMDVFAFPSKFEGFPVVLLEAQISGLPCVVSDKVTKEVDFGSIIYASIDKDPEFFADKILSVNSVSDDDREKFYEDHSERISQYDVRTTVHQLENIYTDLLLKTRKSL